MFLPDQVNEELKNKIREMRKDEVKQFTNIGKNKLQVLTVKETTIIVYFEDINERTKFLNSILMKWE